jgi:DNA-binding LytR/AlgR family response regulator
MKQNHNPSHIFILAVEDDAIYADSLEMILQELGYEDFAITDNAADALKIFKEKNPDIILADIEINGPINGIEFCDIVSSIRNVPIVYLTAFTDKNTFDKAKLTKPSAYLVKPYTSVNLQAAIELALLKASNADNKETGNEKKDKAVVLFDSLFVKYNNKLIKIKVNDIVFVEVDEKYCYINTINRRYAVNIRLKNLLEQLPANQFVQVHRSYAIKLEAIEEVNLEESVIKIDGKEIPVGKTFKDVFFAKLKTI